MARSSRGKKGKAAKAARRGLLGLSATAIGKRKSKQFKKRVERRQNKKYGQETLEILRENISGEICNQGEEPRPPHSFVFHTGPVGSYIRQLERDLRRVMSPHTSKDLRVTRRNNFKDFVVNSQFLAVSHLLVLTRTELSVNFRIIRNPQGPTIHFKVEKYSLARDILSAQKRPVIYEELFEHPPLLVLNGFSVHVKKHLQLVQTIMQNMFPTIDVDVVKLATIKRTLLMHYNEDEDLIEFRHYSIKAVPAGVSRSTKKLLQSKIPDLSKYEDISDFILNPGQLSDSEFDGEQVEMDLPQDFGGRGKKKGQKTKLRLVEIGPRMSLRLLKIEEGINEGEVLYHSFVKKTTKEIALLRKMASTIKKKRLRHEKNVEHATIRKMHSLEERKAEYARVDIKQQQNLLEKQREVTGDYSNSDNDVENHDEDDNDNKYKESEDRYIEVKPKLNKMKSKSKRPPRGKGSRYK